MAPANRGRTGFGMKNHIAQQMSDQQLSQAIKKEAEEKDEKESWVPIPFMGDISNRIAALLRKRLKWKITFLPGTKVSSLLNRIKDPEEDIRNFVYRYSCTSCPKKYIGTSYRPSHIRFSEHFNHHKRKNKGKSAVADHGLGPPKHVVDWENIEILTVESNYVLREIKEGLFIEQSKYPLMNVKTGNFCQALSSSWRPLIPTLNQETGKTISFPIPQ